MTRCFVGVFSGSRAEPQPDRPEETPVIEATGRLGASLTFDGTTVTNRRALLRGSLVGTGDQTIHISQLGAVEFKRAGAITREGFVRFVVAGTTARRSRTGQQNNEARADPCAVVFWRKEQLASNNCVPRFKARSSAIMAVRRTPILAASPTS